MGRARRARIHTDLDCRRHSSYLSIYAWLLPPPAAATTTAARCCSTMPAVACCLWCVDLGWESFNAGGSPLQRRLAHAHPHFRAKIRKQTAMNWCLSRSSSRHPLPFCPSIDRHTACSPLIGAAGPIDGCPFKIIIQGRAGPPVGIGCCHPSKPTTPTDNNNPRRHPHHFARLPLP